MKASLQKKTDSLQLTNVRFLDYQSKEELAHSLSAADLHLVPLTKELSQCLMPSKLYGILAAGRPYLTNSAEGSELYRVTVEYDVGFTCPPGSTGLVAEKIRDAATNRQALVLKGTNARNAATSRFGKSGSCGSFTEILKQIAPDCLAVAEQSLR